MVFFPVDGVREVPGKRLDGGGTEAGGRGDVNPAINGPVNRCVLVIKRVSHVHYALRSAVVVKTSYERL